MSPLRIGLRQRCPACGVGKLFEGLLTVRASCAECGLDLRAQDSGDGPAFFVITLLGALITGLAAWVELAFSPPLWVHIALWLPLVTLGTVYLLRISKALLIAWQYRHRLP